MPLNFVRGMLQVSNTMYGHVSRHLDRSYLQCIIPLDIPYIYTSSILLRHGGGWSRF